MSKLLKTLYKEISFIRGNLFVLITTWILFNFTNLMAFPYETPYIRELGASPFVIGILGSIGSFMLSMVRIPGSYIADRFGRKQIIVLMTFGVAFSYLFYAFAPDWRFILIGIILINLCLIYQPALEAITADSIPADKRGLGYSLVRVITSIPNTISPAVAAVIVSIFGLVHGMRIIYFLIFLASVGAGLLRLFYLKETLTSTEPLTLSGVKESYRDWISSITEAWKETPRNLKLLTAIIMLSAVEDPIFIQFSSLYVLDVVGLKKFHWGVALTSLFITNILFGIPAGKMVDKLGRKKPILIAFFLFVPGIFIFINSRDVFILIISLILFGLGGSIMNPAFNALVVDMVPRQMRGRILGIIGTLNILAQIPAYSIGGYLYEVSPALPFSLLLGLNGILFLIILLFLKEPKKIIE